MMDLSEATNMLKVNLSGFKTEVKEVQLATKNLVVNFQIALYSSGNFQ